MTSLLSTLSPNSLGSPAALAPDSASAIQHGKLVEASQSFEAMMLTEMLKPLHFGAGVDEGGEESAGGAADTIRGMGTDALGKALAAHGGLGIARKIVKEVTSEHDAADAKRGGTKVV
jgi:flagellar protein FlgJ